MERGKEQLSHEGLRKGKKTREIKQAPEESQGLGQSDRTGVKTKEKRTEGKGEKKRGETFSPRWGLQGWVDKCKKGDSEDRGHSLARGVVLLNRP